jgi:hypothetical protein
LFKCINIILSNRMIIVEQFFKVTYFHCGIQIVSQAQTTNRFSVLYGAFRFAEL